MLNFVRQMIKWRLSKETQVTDNQFAFMSERSIMKAIYLLRRLIERYQMDKKDLHLVFIDLEKACDRVPREILGKTLRRKGLGLPKFESSWISKTLLPCV